jgi:hypothetical protein
VINRIENSDNPDFDPAESSWSSGLKCPGGNVGQVVISRLVAAYLDIGINLFGRDGGFYGWRIVNSEVGVNQIGMNIRNFLDPISRSSPVNNIDIIGTYIEMWPFDGAYGIRLDRCWTGAPTDFHRCPHGVHIEGGQIDPKSPLAGPNDLPGRGARPIEVNGTLHVIDVPYHGQVYGTLDAGTQIRSGIYVGQ